MAAIERSSVEQEMVRRLAAGEDPWIIDPDYGCTNPLTGYFPSTEVAAFRRAQIHHKDGPLAQVRQMADWAERGSTGDGIGWETAGKIAKNLRAAADALEADRG